MLSEFEKTRLAVRELVLKAELITSDDFYRILRNHHEFLQEGGAGGYWQTFYIENLIFGTYHGSFADAHILKKQAKISFRNLSKVNLEALFMPYADFSCVYAEGKDWKKSDLEGSLMIDSLLNHCNFKEADLQATDFSRSELRYADLSYANLTNADFERCDLTGADLRSAVIDNTTSFKNAILKDTLLPPAFQ
ncbi:MAG: pentapeptide repeat-containing protein [Cytophagales bacterium]|nr:MAG: pentapeptide repeat-containing protein [Cytophagales bacterium]